MARTCLRKSTCRAWIRSRSGRETPETLYANIPGCACARSAATRTHHAASDLAAAFPARKSMARCSTGCQCRSSIEICAHWGRSTRALELRILPRLLRSLARSRACCSCLTQRTPTPVFSTILRSTRAACRWWVVGTRTTIRGTARFRLARGRFSPPSGQTFPTTNYALQNVEPFPSETDAPNESGLRIWGGGQELWGAMLGISFFNPDGRPRAYDLTKTGAIGIRFWARSSEPGVELKVTLQDKWSEPFAEPRQCCFLDRAVWHQ